MARGVAAAPEVRAAVMAALLAGQSASEVAKQYKVPRQTVVQWQSQMDGSDVRRVRQKMGPGDESFDSLLFGYLRATLRSLTVQAEVFSDEDWLRQQPASEVAVLHGVQADKAIRLLEALERSADPDPERTEL